ncbi:hypothetical protein IVB34_14770 [Bradyrhizobium sp. 2]|uniref:helix-turn-helix transcriptional regulator n=1 Tax=Bradyrhizobium sp. 2 TaxID=190045 RepID=UPI001FF98D83|nr:hypothetical protein [Bradyrhizobium sp. 2]MCK1459617.1 hypothetical protein [Bradyrhizobium sp. 2]
MKETPSPHCPRVLSRVQAAAYVGATPQKFDRMVAAGTMPKPAKIGGADRWDRVQLDKCLDVIFGSETDSVAREVIEFEARPSSGTRLSIEERRLLSNWGLSETDPTTWLTEEEAAIWMEEYRQDRKRRKRS